MDIKTGKDTIVLVPLIQYDYYLLGLMHNRFAHKITVISDNKHTPEIQCMEINKEDLISYLTKGE